MACACCTSVVMQRVNANLMAQALAIASLFVLLLASSTQHTLIMCVHTCSFRCMCWLSDAGWSRMHALCSLTPGGTENASQEALQDEQVRDAGALSAPLHEPVNSYLLPAMYMLQARGGGTSAPKCALCLFPATACTAIALVVR
jgi:hypothetical protein